MRFKPAPANLISQLLTTSRASLSRTAVPYSPTNLAITSILLRQGLISNLSLGSPDQPEPQNFHTLPLPAQRLWVGLKHRQGQPVLRRISLISKGSKRVVVSKDELGRLLTGRRAQNVDGVGMGEVLVVRDLNVDGKGWLEGWEAWRLGIGGELVCRAGWGRGERVNVEMNGVGWVGCVCVLRFHDELLLFLLFWQAGRWN